MFMTGMIECERCGGGAFDHFDWPEYSSTACTRCGALDFCLVHHDKFDENGENVIEQKSVEGHGMYFVEWSNGEQFGKRFEAPPTEADIAEFKELYENELAIREACYLTSFDGENFAVLMGNEDHEYLKPYED